MARRFEKYQPSTALRHAIARYREAIAEGKHKVDSGRAQPEGEAVRDTPGHGGAEEGATRQGDDGMGGAHE